MSRCPRESCSRRWRACRSRRFDGRDAASAQASSAPRWSPRPESSTGTSARSAICASRPTSIPSRSRSSAPSLTRWPRLRGCPVRKVTKAGAGAHLMENPELACRVVEAVAGAVRVPVTVKMRRGVENGSRACLELGPKLVASGAAALTLHPRSAQQMYTGEAEHALTAELVSLVAVPVIASGDVTSREKALAVLEETGAAAVMVARGAQGNPWALREIVEGESFRPTREEVAAELVVFIREAVRELGEQRAVGFLKKFYGWYLGHGRFPKPFKQELVQLRTTDGVVMRLFAAAPGAAPLVEALEAELPAAEDETVLDRLPIS